MLKKIVTASLLVLLVSTLAFSFQQSAPWEKFNSPEGKFNVLMPSKPKAQTSEVDSAIGKLTLYVYASPSSIGYFAVSYGDYPVEPKDASQKESVLDRVQNGILSNLKTEPVSAKKISLYGHPGREFSAKKMVEGADAVFNWRILLVGNRLYQLVAVTAQKDSESPEVAKFITSFELNK
ncbi:MAG: hypothetical protein QOH25_3720 [Acidobacteriota bacterium]|jgi:hypothetical protein|nr:hypothetical protein [Acidobacteriota bacterium]